jgi:hypothetical protein
VDSWMLTFEVAGVEPALLENGLDRLVDLLEPFGGAVSATLDRGGYTATFAVAETTGEGVQLETATDVVSFGQELLSRLAAEGEVPAAPIVHAEVSTSAEHEARMSRLAFPELVGVSELAELLDITHSRATALVRSKDFPMPVAELQSGPVWRRDVLQRFAGDSSHRPSRPRRQDSYSANFYDENGDLTNAGRIFTTEKAAVDIAKAARYGGVVHHLAACSTTGTCIFDSHSVARSPDRGLHR